MTWFGKNEMLCGDVDIFKYVFFKNKYACIYIYIFVLKTYIYIVDIHNVFKYVFTKNKYVYICS